MKYSCTRVIELNAMHMAYKLGILEHKICGEVELVKLYLFRTKLFSFYKFYYLIEYIQICSSIFCVFAMLFKVSHAYFYHFIAQYVFISNPRNMKTPHIFLQNQMIQYFMIHREDCQFLCINS